MLQVPDGSGQYQIIEESDIGLKIVLFKWAVLVRLLRAAENDNTTYSFTTTNITHKVKNTVTLSIFLSSFPKNKNITDPTKTGYINLTRLNEHEHLLTSIPKNQ